MKRLGIATATLAATALATLLAGTSSAEAALVRVGTATARPASARELGTLPSSTSLTLTVALTSRDPSGLAAYATDVSDPSSPEYRRYLTVAEFARRFGATPAAVTAVRSTLDAEGLSVDGVSRNDLSLAVRTSAETAGRALHTSFERVRADGRTAYLNRTAPEVPESIGHDIQAISGLQTLDEPRPLLARREMDRSRAKTTSTARTSDTPANTDTAANTDAAEPCSAATTAVQQPDNEGSLTISQIATDYDFDALYTAGDLGSGVTVGVYELEPNIPSDITAYEDCFGTDATVTYDQVDGGAPGTPTEQNEDGIETEIDVENIIGLAPDAKVIVYQGPNDGDGPYDVLQTMVTDDTAKVLSTSWGECEADIGANGAEAENTLYEEAATQGQTVVAASGDYGAEDCYADPDVDHGNSTAPAVDDPASQPYVTGVGGTDIESSSPLTQTVWNNGYDAYENYGGGAGGGGDSQLWSMPSYQSTDTTSLGVVNAESSKTCGTNADAYCREVPDVSADADDLDSPYLIYWDGDGSDTDQNAWIGVAGTSGAAPVWAALFALADASGKDTCESSPVGFANPKLYGLARSSEDNLFDDITTGENDLLGTNDGEFAAAAGYDQASGLGTPKAAALVAALCSSGTVSLSQPAAQTTHVNHSGKLTLQASDSLDATLTYAAAGLPRGLTLDTKTGVISGTPTKAGRYEVTVTAAASGQSTVTRRFAWTVEGAPTVSKASLKRAKKTHATLALSAKSGTDAPDLNRIAVTLPSGLSLTKSARQLRRAVTVRSATGAKLSIASVKRSGRTVTITLKRASPTVRLSVAAAAIDLPTKKHLRKTTKLALALRDAAAWTTRLTVSARS